MNHTETPSKRSLTRTVLGLSVIALCVLSILFNGTARLNQEQAQAHLAELAKWLETGSQGHSLQPRINYEKVIIQGLAFDKEALLKSFSVDVVRQLWQGNKRFTLSADEAKFQLEPINEKAKLISMGGAIHAIAGSELVATLVPSLPVRYKASPVMVEGKEGFSHFFESTGGWEITTATKASLQLALKDPLQAKILTFGSGLIKGNLSSGFVRVTTGDDVWKIGNVVAHFTSHILSPQALETKGLVTIENLLLQHKNKDVSTSPLLATFAFHSNEKMAVNGGVESTELEIDRGVVSFGDVRIAVNGKLNFDIDDVTPYGEIILEFNNISDFINSGWVREESRQQAFAMVDQIFEPEAKVRKQAIINVWRAKGGEWKVGIASLESLEKQGLFNIFISNGLF